MKTNKKPWPLGTLSNAKGIRQRIDTNPDFQRPAVWTTIPGLLRASHIKPWAVCNDDNERLDVYNGLLLAPQVDALFDGGWATFEPNGELRLAVGVDREAMHALGLMRPLMTVRLSERHQSYIAFHRLYVFRDQATGR